MNRPPSHDIKVSATIQIPESLIKLLIQSISVKSALAGLKRGQERLEMTVQEALDAVNAKLDASTDKATAEREEVRLAVEGMQDTITELKDEVTALRDQIANGTEVTEEQLQSVLTNVEELDLAIGEVYSPDTEPVP